VHGPKVTGATDAGSRGSTGRAQGYTFAGPTLPLGALVENDVAVPGAQVGLPLSMMNRHGLIAGATGTGKTRTLQAKAEALSTAGAPARTARLTVAPEIPTSPADHDAPSGPGHVDRRGQSCKDNQAARGPSLMS